MNKQPRLLKCTIKNISRYENNVIEIDLTNHQRIRSSKQTDIMHNIFSSTYLPKIISLVGINASGKTTTLDILRMIFSLYFCNGNINDEKHIDLIKSLYMEKTIMIEIYYTVNNFIYCLKSDINLNNNLNINELEYLVNDSSFPVNFKYTKETLLRRSINNEITKISLFDLDNYEEWTSREAMSDEAKSFLEFDKSITSLTISKDDSSYMRSYYTSNLSFDFNLSRLPKSIIQYFDSSIEYIKDKPQKISSIKKDGSVHTIKLSNRLYEMKFYGKLPVELTAKELDSILSSGTKKGLELFSEITSVLSSGGYLIVDELENHFNKSIIIDILKLFKDPKTNPKAASLIFSTHYPELLESIERNDCIFINYRNKETNEICITVLSDLLKRNDLTKSELFLSDYWEIGTAIEYKKYIAVKNEIIDYQSKPTSNKIILDLNSLGKSNE